MVDAWSNRAQDSGTTWTTRTNIDDTIGYARSGHWMRQVMTFGYGVIFWSPRHLQPAPVELDVWVDR